MKVIKYTLIELLVLIFLSSCTEFSEITQLPSETGLETTNTQPGSPTAYRTPTPASTPSFADTPQAVQGTELINLPPTEAMLVPMVDFTPDTCMLTPVTQPPQPVKTFQPNELDPETGLHVTGRPQWVDLSTYRLKVTGLVDHSLSLTYDALRCMPKVTAAPELICMGVFIDHATWTGVPLTQILELAGVQPGAKTLTMLSADGYQVHLSLDIANAGNNFLAYEVDGKPLPVEHGFPLRAVFPDMWGSYWLKWLVEIQIS